MIKVKDGGFFLAVAFLLSSLVIRAEIKEGSSQGQSSFIIMLLTDEATSQLSDDELWQRSAVVRFPVGSAYIPYSDPGFRKIVKAVEKLKDSLVAEVPQELVSDGKNSICGKKDTLVVASENNSAVSPLGYPCLNVKTNILYDLALLIPQYGYAPTPNISLEYLPKSGHITPMVELTWAPWRNDSRSKTWIVHNLLLEGRYYIHSTDLYVGHYMSAYANVGAYDIQFNKSKAWLSDKWSKNYGFGIGWGYVKRFQENSRWKWEVNAALGYLHSSYDGYHDAESWADKDKNYFDWHENPSDYRRYQNHLNYWGLTRFGFSISYDLF